MWTIMLVSGFDLIQQISGPCEAAVHRLDGSDYGLCRQAAVKVCELGWVLFLSSFPEERAFIVYLNTHLANFYPFERSCSGWLVG